MMTATGDERMRSPTKAWMRALERTAAIGREPTLTLPLLIDRLATRFGEREALAGTDSRLSYRALAEAGHRFARWGLAQGLARGDVVCLLMRNCPEYLAIWLGLSRIQVTVALLNTNLTGELLRHSIEVVRPRLVIAGSAHCGALAEVRPRLGAALGCWAYGPDGGDLARLDRAVESLDGASLTEAERPPPALGDRALYIYTSGTTGLPKAANVSHLRLMQWSHWFAGLVDARPDDRLYNCLPMYHSVGGVVATGAALVAGASVVLRERFSVSNFWKDVVAERCTLFQYIGELCRYLLNGPHDPLETRHQLRLACGNGLRAEVWEPFQARFRIPQILEYYASTEGNFSLYNCEGRVGAIGRIPPFLAHRMPVVVVKHDYETVVPARGDDGRCIRCAANEVGEAIGEILDSGGTSRFEGYADPTASDKKVLRDVFAPGDAWYRTGDLMRRDEQGFFYFVDRVGDTFRWKGENVSTTEVAAAIAGCRGVTEVAVYGVKVPHAEGRAGMAALVVGEGFELAELRRAVSTLPPYARPVFVRLAAALEVTATFKLRTQELTRQGYDPSAISDALYADDTASGEYLRLDAGLHERIMSGQQRL
jgi:fatty-acyl-CoA synthase